ncbi:MAG: anti-sigma factor family protein [Gemmatimonadaceae bacterium]
MTTGAINCDRFGDRLMDYLEQDMDVATRASIEEHAAACDECGALLADIRKLRVDAAHLPELTPARDLWTEIAARIETPVVPIGAGSVATTIASTPHRNRRRWLNSGLIAASLLAAAAIGYSARGTDQIAPQDDVVETRDVPSPPVVVPGPADTKVAQNDAPQAPTEGVIPRSGAPARPLINPPASGPSVAGTRPVEVQLAVAALSADYDREIARLRILIDQRRSQLDPATVSVIERNLAVIDTAIAESHRAIANDPSGRFLLEFLNQSLQAKVELMRTAALLPSRT